MERLERFIETFFRHKWFFVCVLVLVPPIGFGYAIKQRQVLYQSSASVWADRPAYFNVGDEWNSYLTPAQNQANSVAELMKTDAFVTQVIAQTDLRKYLGDEQDTSRALDSVKKRVAVQPVGTHVLTITDTDEQPKIAAQVVAAVITTFNNEMLAQAATQSAVALSYYQHQLDDANKALVDSTTALGTYLAAHPELKDLPKPSDSVMPEINTTAFAIQNQDLVKLLQQRDTAQKDQQRLQSQVDSIRQAQNSTSVMQSQSFRLMDPPSVPKTPQSGIRLLALRVGLTLVVTIVLEAGALYILTLLDTSLQNEQMAAAHLKLPVLASIPVLPERRGLVRRRRIYRRSVLRLVALCAVEPQRGEVSGETAA